MNNRKKWKCKHNAANTTELAVRIRMQQLDSSITRRENKSKHNIHITEYVNRSEHFNFGNCNQEMDLDRSGISSQPARTVPWLQFRNQNAAQLNYLHNLYIILYIPSAV